MHTTRQAYSLQLEELARQLGAAGRHGEVERHLGAGSSSALVKVFVDGNLDKRLDKLTGQLALVSEAFDDFESLAMDYCRATYARPYETSCSDGERMLDWLRETQPLDDRRRDYLTVQSARHDVEAMARQLRLEYIRFQDLHCLNDRLEQEVAAGDYNIHVMLNPTRKWAQLRTDALLDGEAEPPADVLLYATRGEIATAIVELEGQALVNELADFQPCSLAQWQFASFLDADRIAEMSREFSKLGIMAFY